MSCAYVGLGSNVGNPVAHIRTAVDQLRKTKGIDALRLSSLYRSAPVGYEDQAWFVNAAAALYTSLPPRALLQELQAVERRMGRSTPFRWGPRNIDCDILLFEALIVDEPGLTIPHPRLAERRFALEPLVELIPDGIHPALDKTFRELLAALGDTQKVSRLQESA